MVNFTRLALQMLISRTLIVLKNIVEVFTAFLHRFGLHCVPTFLNVEGFMSVIYLGLVVVFFVVTVLLVQAFEKLRGQS